MILLDITRNRWRTVTSEKRLLMLNPSNCIQYWRRTSASQVLPQVPGGDVGGQHATWQQEPRVLQRSEGFRRSADEVEADLIGHGDAGAAAYHPKPAARLLEELVQKDGVQRASVMEVRFRMLSGPACCWSIRTQLSGPVMQQATHLEQSEAR